MTIYYRQFKDKKNYCVSCDLTEKNDQSEKNLKIKDGHNFKRIETQFQFLVYFCLFSMELFDYITFNFKIVST